jgi:transcriptional regulator with XRE-family HTH domain
MTPNAAPWPASLTRSMARRIPEIRRAKGMTAEKLAEAVSAIGLRYTRAQVTNLEAKRRDTITVAELIALAATLGVPPALLLFPVGSDESVELLPGLRMDPWHAYKLFVGDMNLVAGGALDGAETNGPNVSTIIRIDPAVETFRRHDQAMSAVLQSREGDESETADARVQWLASIRREMRARGGSPPPLPFDLEVKESAADERQERRMLARLAGGDDQ